MAAPIEKWSKVEVRGVIRFLHAEGKNPAEIYRKLVAVYGDKVMSCKQVWLWCTAFTNGRTDLEDEPRTGRPRSSTTDENVTRVESLIREDRRLKIREMAMELDLPKSVVHEIVHDNLGFRKVSCRWVPKQLTDEHKFLRMGISLQLLERYREPDGDFLDKLITGDETWLHLTTPETKADSMTWKHPWSPTPRKFKVQHSVKKVMATVFWDAKGVLLVDILPQGETINALRYCETIDRLREAVRRKRPGLLRKGVVLLHDNATPHTANVTKQWFERYGWEVLPHPPHSPDLAPSDFHLFGPLKRHLSGKRFNTNEEVVANMNVWLKSLDQDFFGVGIFALVHRWDKCINLYGDYVEK